MRFAQAAGPSGSKDPERKKLFNVFNKKLDDDEDMQEEEEKEPEQDEDGPQAVWRSEQRFLLRKKIAEAQALISPEKSFLLPTYAERHARRVESSRRLQWESKGRRSKRGPDGKFYRSQFVDDQAGASKYLDLSAESTSTESSSADDQSSRSALPSSRSSSSRGTASDESSAESNPPVDFVTFPA
ncbi:unnamed protein product [Calypogeia fissa]